MADLTVQRRAAALRGLPFYFKEHGIICKTILVIFFLYSLLYFGNAWNHVLSLGVIGCALQKNAFLAFLQSL